MVAQAYWFAMGGFTTLMTFAWLFIERRVTSTGLFAGIGWSFLAVTGNDIHRFTETGAEIQVPLGNLQYFCAGMAFLSFFAVLAYRYGHFPPKDDDPTSADYP